MANEPWWLHPELGPPEGWKIADPTTQPVFHQIGPCCSYAAIQNQLGFSLGSNRDAGRSRLREHRMEFFGYDKPLDEIDEEAEKVADGPKWSKKRQDPRYLKSLEYSDKGLTLRERNLSDEWTANRSTEDVEEMGAKAIYDLLDVSKPIEDIEKLYGRENVRLRPPEEAKEIKNGFLRLRFRYSDGTSGGHRVAVRDGWVIDSSSRPSWKIDQLWTDENGNIRTPDIFVVMWKEYRPNLVDITVFSVVEITDLRVGQLAPRYDGLPVWHDEYEIRDRKAIKKIFSPIRQSPYDRRRAPLKYTYPIKKL